jgi:predicted lipoprotein with Yx(FWY)xxD motif
MSHQAPTASNFSVVNGWGHCSTNPLFFRHFRDEGIWGLDVASRIGDSESRSGRTSTRGRMSSGRCSPPATEGSTMKLRAVVASASVLALLVLAGCAVGDQSTSTTKLAIANSMLGQVIVNDKGITAYAYDSDRPGIGAFACIADCKTVWTPIRTNSPKPVVDDGITAPVGVTWTTGGAGQITVAGMLLYTFVGDKTPGDTNGQLANTVWHALTPAGQKIG